MHPVMQRPAHRWPGEAQALRLPEGVPQTQPWAGRDAARLLGHLLLKGTVADVYCTNRPADISKFVKFILERNTFGARIFINTQNVLVHV